MITLEQQATGTQRIIYQCKNKACKHTWAYDYLTIPAGKDRFNLLRHDEQNTRVWSTDDRCQGCPECGTTDFKTNEVVGIVTSHVCDAKCRNAKGPICECACGGLHHGEGFIKKH